MKVHKKRLLSVLLAVVMTLSLAVGALASSVGTDSSGTSIQITKTLKIGQGITVPTETFEFTFAPVTSAEAAELGETGSYIVPGATQAGGSYPDLSALGPFQVAYDANKRTADGTDTELTFLSSEINLADSRISWTVPGLYIYSLQETSGSTQGMSYDNAKYFLKVYVKNVNGGGVAVNSVAVYGKDSENNWVKIDGAPTDQKEAGTSGSNDGSEDYAGNELRFVNTYKKYVETVVICWWAG